MIYSTTSSRINSSAIICIVHRSFPSGGFEHGIPCGSGQPEKVDSEYVRKGVMDVFMIAEPLAGKRDTVVTEKRTAIDFAHILQRTSDVLYPQARLYEGRV